MIQKQFTATGFTHIQNDEDDGETPKASSHMSLQTEEHRSLGSQNQC